MGSPLDKYTRGRLLGSGSYGTATLFTTRESKKVVIKEIDLKAMSPSDIKAAEGEVKVGAPADTSREVAGTPAVPARTDREAACCGARRAGSQCRGCCTAVAPATWLVCKCWRRAQVLQMLHNSNIVSCVESFRHQGKLCIVMDYCSEGGWLP